MAVVAGSGGVQAGARWQECPAKIPVPGVASLPRSRIFQRLEFEAPGRQTNAPPVIEQGFPIRGDQVRHRAALPYMAVEPEPPVYRMDHPLASRGCFPVRQPGAGAPPVGFHALFVDDELRKPRFQPVRAGADFHQEGNGQARRPLHLPLHQRGQPLNFIGRRLEHQFIMDLQ
jgi:hypothetical protein